MNGIGIMFPIMLRMKACHNGISKRTIASGIEPLSSTKGSMATNMTTIHAGIPTVDSQDIILEPRSIFKAEMAVRFSGMRGSTKSQY